LRAQGMQACPTPLLLSGSTCNAIARPLYVHPRP
jgi:hypothetical protein